MVLSSPRTRYYKRGVPAVVFAGTTGVALFTTRDELFSEPGGTMFVLLALYLCAAWVLWRPWRLKIADHVEDRAGVLHIRRGGTEVQVSYSDLLGHEYLRIGASFGVKLTFKQPNEFGSAVGFYLNEQPEASRTVDPGEHLERQFKNSRDLGAV